MNSFSSSKKGKVTYVLQILSTISLIAKVLKIERIVKKLVLLVVRGYQRYISPYKGFSCAYKKLYKTQSCSAYFYSCVSDRALNLSTASNLLQQRLFECKQAYSILQTDLNYHQQSKQKKRRRNNNECGSCSEWIDFTPLLYWCDCGDCLDCGDCDLGICDF